MDSHSLFRNKQVPFKRLRIIAITKQISKSILMLTFLPDGSLIIDPSAYSSLGNWRYGIIDIPAGELNNATIPMDEASIVYHPNQGPKFTYHKSGIVKVSKTGNLPPLRLTATPLSQAHGHIFTFMVKGFQHFADAQIPNSKYIQFAPLLPDNIETLKISGFVGNLIDFVPEKDSIPEEAFDMPVKFFTKYRNSRVEFTLIRFHVEGRERWLKLEFWPNIEYNSKENLPSISTITGWPQEAENVTQPFQMIGIGGGEEPNDSSSSAI